MFELSPFGSWGLLDPVYTFHRPWATRTTISGPFFRLSPHNPALLFVHHGGSCISQKFSHRLSFSQERGESQVLLKPFWMFLLTLREFSCMESQFTALSSCPSPYFSVFPFFVPSSHLPLPPRCEVFSTLFFLTGCNQIAFLFSLSPRWHSPVPPWGGNGEKAIQEKPYYYSGGNILENFEKNIVCMHLLFHMNNTWTIPSVFTYHLTFSKT